MAKTLNRGIDKVGIIATTDGRTRLSYAVLERLADGWYYTYLRHYDVGGETRVASHRTYDEARRRYDALSVAVA